VGDKLSLAFCRLYLRGWVRGGPKHEKHEKHEKVGVFPYKMSYLVRIVCETSEKVAHWSEEMKEKLIMNIFYLSNEPKEIAYQLCDKHIVKMPLESAQMLSSAWWSLPYDKIKHKIGKIYRPVHMGHPSTIWTYSARENYLWHYKLFEEMLKEYTRRYNKVHKSSELLEELAECPLTEGAFTEPPQCMPDKYKCDDTITAYRNYYIGDKTRFAKYAYGPTPTWLEEYI